jgi:hypothetical protein
MTRLHSIAAALAAAVVLTCCGVAWAAPVTVNLRVEGSSQTLYEGSVTTDAKTLTKDNTGPHPCDGTNGGVNPTPGPTMTGAMDDGATAAGFTWAATWDDGYQDFFISRIGPDTNTGAPNFQPYWGYFHNWVATQIGGCQQQVSAGDAVLFAYSNYGEPLLQLSGPGRAATGQSFSVTVQQNDGNGNRTVAPGANVQGHTTDAAGQATLSFSDPGVKRIKATRSGSVRSNAIDVCVYAEGSGDCGTTKAGSGEPGPPAQETPGQPAPPAKDTTPPLVTIGQPVDGRTYAKGPRLLSGNVSDDHGLQQVFLRVRKPGSGASKTRCRWYSAKREVFTHRSVPCSRSRFFRIGKSGNWSYLLPARLRTGGYVLDVKALDTSYNAGRATASFRVR